MTRTHEDKQELRKMSRKDAVRVVGEILEVYQARGDSGIITIDVRSGKAIWVRPVITDCLVNPQSSCTLDALKQLNVTLQEFENCDASGTVAIRVSVGQAVELTRQMELDKVRVG